MTNRTASLPGVVWYALPALSGWLVALASPPHPYASLIWIALVPLFLFLNHCASPWQALRGAWLAGVVYFLLIVYPFTSLIWWGWAQTAQEYAAALKQQQTFLRVWHPLTALWCGGWWGLWGAALVALAKRSRSRVWLAAGLWIVLCEYGRSIAFFDFTWGFLGYALHPYRILCQIASVTGVMGLSALIVLVNAWLAHALRDSVSALLGRRIAGDALQEALREVWLAASVVIAAAGSFSLGAFIEHRITTSHQPAITVAALQAGARKYTRDELTSGSLDWAYEPLISSALRGEAQLIVLPESVWLARLALDDVPTPQTLSKPVTPADVLAFLGPKLAGTHASVLADFEVAEQGKLHNSIVGWNEQGMIGRYDKRRLTPFAEYAPGLWQRLAPKGRLMFTRGTQSRLFDVHGIRIGSFICQEVQFPFITRRSVRDGAQVLVSTGNDGIFRDPAVAQIHHVMAQFRAMETQRPMVRAMKTGLSSILAANGRVVTVSERDQPATLLDRVIPSSEMGLYVRWGDWIVLAAAALVLGAAAARVTRRSFFLPVPQAGRS